MDHQLWKQRVRQEGYSAFREYLMELEVSIRQYEDANDVSIPLLLRDARNTFPQPGIYSPSWQDAWSDFEWIVEGKNDVLNRVSPDQRDGEWQLLIDNPFSHEGVSCHPGLTFMDAAFLYGKMLIDLKENEVLRLQKIEDAIVRHATSCREKAHR
jgi:hypothetical protein